MELSIQHYFEFLSLLISVIYIGKLRNHFLITFVPYLLLILAVELIAKYLAVNFHYKNIWVYNLLNLLSHSYYAFIFYCFAQQKIHRKVIVVLTITYIVSSLTYYLFTSFYEFNNVIISIGGVLGIFLACLHFYYYLQNDNYVHERHFLSGLFIASGVLIFYSGIAICFSLYNYIRINDLRLFGDPLYRVIPRSLSIFLYLLISIAIIIWKRPTKTLY